MKQVHANYTFVAATKTITLTGLNIAQDQLLLVTNATRGVIYYNFASSSHRAVVTAGANTTVVLTDASTTGHEDSDQLVIHYDDQLSTQTIAGTVTANLSQESFRSNPLNAYEWAIPIGYNVGEDSVGTVNYYDMNVNNGPLPVRNGSDGDNPIPLAISASSLPLPSGAATSANQATANTSLSNIDTDLGAQADASASSDTGTFSLISLFKRLLSRITSLVPANLTVTSTRLLVDGRGVTQPVNGAVAANLHFYVHGEDGGYVPVSLSNGTEVPEYRLPVDPALKITFETFTTQVGVTGADGEADPDIDLANYLEGSLFLLNGSVGSGTTIKFQWVGSNNSTQDIVLTRPFIGTTTTNVSPGEHLFVIRKPNGFRYLRIVIVAGGGSAFAAFVLKAHSDPYYGMLRPGEVSLSNIDTDLGAQADASASSDTGTFSLISLFKRLLSRITTLVPANLTVSSTRLLVDGSGVTQPVSGTVTANLAPQVKGPIVEADSTIPSDPKYMAAVGGVYLGGGTNEYRFLRTDSGGQVQVGSLPAISGTVTANAGTGTFNVSDRGATGEATVSSFTSTTSSTLEPSNPNRKLLAIFNEGAGNLHVLYGAGTASTTNYSVRLSAGDYLEIEKYTGQVNAVFATAGTARVTEIT